MKRKNSCWRQIWASSKEWLVRGHTPWTFSWQGAGLYWHIWHLSGEANPEVNVDNLNDTKYPQWKRKLHILEEKMKETWMSGQSGSHNVTILCLFVRSVSKVFGKKYSLIATKCSSQSGFTSDLINTTFIPTYRPYVQEQRLNLALPNEKDMKADEDLLWNEILSPSPTIPVF